MVCCALVRVVSPTRGSFIWKLLRAIPRFSLPMKLMPLRMFCSLSQATSRPHRTGNCVPVADKENGTVTWATGHGVRNRLEPGRYSWAGAAALASRRPRVRRVLQDVMGGMRLGYAVVLPRNRHFLLRGRTLLGSVFRASAMLLRPCSSSIQRRVRGPSVPQAGHRPRRPRFLSCGSRTGGSRARRCVCLV